MSIARDRRDEAELMRPASSLVVWWKEPNDPRPEAEQALAMLADGLVYSNRERCRPMSVRTSSALNHAIHVLRRSCGTTERSYRNVLDAWVRAGQEAE